MQKRADLGPQIAPSDILDASTKIAKVPSLSASKLHQFFAHIDRLLLHFLLQSIKLANFCHWICYFNTPFL